MIHYFLYFAVLVLAACSSEVVDEQDVAIIEIEPIMADQTRGEPYFDLDDMTRFGAWGFYNGEIYIDNGRVTAVDGVWGFTPDEYWPQSGEVDFFACSPYISPGYSGASGRGLTLVGVSEELLQIEYVVPTRCRRQPDLIVAAATGSRSSLELPFKHALAAISFSVKGSDFSAITAIEVSNIIDEAVLSFDRDGDIAWGSFSDRSSTTYEVNMAKSAEEDEQGLALLTDSNGYLMMIPQSLSGVELMVEVDGQSHIFSFDQDEEWQAGYLYNYVIDPYGETLSSASQISNCYIVNPSGDDITIYIPVDERINDFWQNYSSLADSELVDYLIDSNTQGLTAELLWYDCDQLGEVECEIITSSLPVASGTVTPQSAPNFLTSDCQVAMKITLSAATTNGNLIFAVENDDCEVLWSWHIWYTDYNPDSVAEELVAGYVWSVDGGQIHRYDDSSNSTYTPDSPLWSEGGAYEGKYIMDRYVGSRDATSPNYDGVGLCYQWGRKDPFPSSNKGKLPDGSSYYPLNYDVTGEVSYATAVNNPKYFFKATRTNWCSESSSNSIDYIWNDSKISASTYVGKSIFDPSPLGWRLPLNGTWSDFNGNLSGYYYTKRSAWDIYYPTSGYRMGDSGSLSAASMAWSATPYSEGYGFYLYLHYGLPNTSSNEQRSHALPVRAVQE